MSEAVMKQRPMRQRTVRDRTPAAATKQFNWNHHPPGFHDMPDGVSKCSGCDEHGHSSYTNSGSNRIGVDCPLCDGVGYNGIDTGACESKKGSLHRSLVYRKRYIDGLPLYHDGDSPDHEETRLNRDDGPEPWTVPEVHDWDDED